MVLTISILQKNNELGEKHCADVLYASEGLKSVEWLMWWQRNEKMLLINPLMEGFFDERLFVNSFHTHAHPHTHTQANKKHFALDTHELCGPLVNSHTDIQALTHVHSNALCYLILHTHKHPQAHTPMCTPMHTHAHTRTHTHLHSHALTRTSLSFSCTRNFEWNVTKANCFLMTIHSQECWVEFRFSRQVLSFPFLF